MVSETAIRKLLRRNWIGPAPLRSGQTWKAFLQTQASAIVLSDLFGVGTVFLKRLYVLLDLELATRRVIWFAVTDRPLACLGRPSRGPAQTAAFAAADGTKFWNQRSQAQVAD